MKMKWIKARSEKICTACDATIEENELYFGGSYQTFCKPCGIKYKNGDLRYSAKTKSYIDIASKKDCDFCGEPAIFYHKPSGKSVCNEHIGSVIDDQV